MYPTGFMGLLTMLPKSPVAEEGEGKSLRDFGWPSAYIFAQPVLGA